MTQHRPIVSEPDQRYWRARANRKVRKARYIRTLLRWSVILLINGAFLGTLAFLGMRGVQRLTSSDEFTLRRIELVGLQRTSEESIRLRLAPMIGRNLFDLDLGEVNVVLRNDPWVLDASARRILPRTLRVTVTERKPAALAVIRGVAHIVDRTGHVIGPAGARSADDLPVLTGLDGMPDEELIEALQTGVTMVERLRKVAGPFADEISEMDLSQSDRISVRTIARGPRILLDPNRVERNVQRFLALRSVMAERLGPIRYVDLRWRDRIAVMPVFKTDEQKS
jgi:cell division septal protein FtsQ